MANVITMNVRYWLLLLVIAGLPRICCAWELLTNEHGPYSYQDANWRAGNYIQSLFYDYSDLPALSENFIGKGIIPSTRLPDLYYIGNTGIDLLDYCEEAEFTPIVRLELIKKIFKSMYKSHYSDADAIWLVYSGTKRQVSFLNPCTSSGGNYEAAATYPASRLIARNLPDTGPEKLSIIWPRVQVNGKWYDDSNSTYRDSKDNVYDEKENSYVTIRNYLWNFGSECTIQGKGWSGQKDKVLEITVSAPQDKKREALQLVFSNFTDPKMGFSSPYPTELPETIQLPDRKEISSKQFSISNPDFNYIIIYTKDEDRTGFEYQNAMFFGWEDRPSKLTVHWEPSGKAMKHDAYPGTEGRTDSKSEWHSGGYCRVDVEYSGTDTVSKKLYMERFQGVDPSASLRHIHRIAHNIVTKGTVGMPGYLATESAWIEEPVSALAAAAYILCKYDKEEDKFGGDYATEARDIASKLVDDRIAMWQRGRKSSSYQEFVSGAYYLSLLYDLPGKFNNREKKKYYYDWMCRWTDQMVADGRKGSRDMMAIWRAYERSGNNAYKELYQKGRDQFGISESNGLTVNGKWKEPKDFYSYGDVMGALGRRGYCEDVNDIQKLISYLTDQNRWTDTGYMGVWWEVTVENHNFFGRWCKGLQMADAPKRIITVSQFPVYYKKGNEVVVEMKNMPIFYNPAYWDTEVMKNYLPLLQHKIAKSILFRIDNILLKNDYQHDWWVGTHVPRVINDVKTIRTDIQKILTYIDEGTATTSNYATAQKLLAECDALYKSAANAIEGNPGIVGEPAGNPIDLRGELQACKWNFDYLQAVLNGWPSGIEAHQENR